MIAFPSFTEAYQKLLAATVTAPEHVVAPRGQSSREILGASFGVRDPRDRLPFQPARDYSASYFAAETLWYLSGDSSTAWIARYAPFWLRISDDGKTANSAYGARIFRPQSHLAMPGSQWEWVKSELRRDPDSRRAIIHIRSPRDSWHAKLDVPCTLSLQFFIRSGKLYLWVTMRSSDLHLGLANDVPAFTLLQELMALELGVGLGEYLHASGSSHVYDRDAGRIKQIVSAPAPDSQPMPPMPCPPPVEEMLRWEEHVSSHPALAVGCDLVPYWRDWIVLLGLHWARKAGDAETISSLSRELWWDGWRSFKR